MFLVPLLHDCFLADELYILCCQTLAYLIICLPLWETYIVFPSVYVCPSVCPSVTLPLCEPYFQEPFVHKHLFFLQLTYILKLCNKKLKFNLAKNVEVLVIKPLFKFVFCVGKFSVTINGRGTKISCSVSKDICIVHR